jgi:hypothetical protein
MAGHRRRRGLSGPLLLLVGILAGIALAGALRLILILAVAAALAALAATARAAGWLELSPRRKPARVKVARATATRARPAPSRLEAGPGGTHGAGPPPAGQAGPAAATLPAPAGPNHPDAIAALRAMLAGRADQVSTRVPPPARGPERTP